MDAVVGGGDAWRQASRSCEVYRVDVQVPRWQTRNVDERKKSFMSSEPPLLRAVKAAIFQTDGPASSPVLVSGGRVYVAHGMSESGRTKGGVVCFTRRTLVELWATTFAEGVGDSALVLSKGRLFAGCNAGLVSLDADSGSVRWIWKSEPGGTYQECSPLVVDEVVVIGSPTGHVHGIHAETGVELWRTKICDEPVFGQPCSVLGDVVVCSMGGTVGWIEPASGAVRLRHKVHAMGRDLEGCFAKPVQAFEGVVFATTDGCVVEVDMEGNTLSFTAGFRKFLAPPAVVDQSLFVADMRGRCAWLGDRLVLKKELNLSGRFLFGAPCVAGRKIVLTTYGDEYVEFDGQRAPKFSTVYVVEEGSVLEARRIPMSLHALAGVALDESWVYAPMTPFTSTLNEWKFAALAAFEMDSLREFDAGPDHWGQDSDLGVKHRPQKLDC